MISRSTRTCASPASTKPCGLSQLDVVRPLRRVDEEEMRFALHLMGLADKADRYPRDLSLGQQKLAGVARAMCTKPAVLLLDEPAAGLDSRESVLLGDRLCDIAADGTSILLIDHDMGLVLETCDYIYVLEFGRVIAEGTPDMIRSDPAVIEAYLGTEGSAADRASRGERRMSEIRITDLVAGHNGVPAVRGLTLSVDAGEVVALLGPNGAGKSTTLWTIAGALPIISGSVEVLGQPIGRRSVFQIARSGVALVPEDRGLFYQLTVLENLQGPPQWRLVGDLTRPDLPVSAGAVGFGEPAMRVPVGRRTADAGARMCAPLEPTRADDR